LTALDGGPQTILKRFKSALQPLLLMLRGTA
jgi:hypothetical protein